MSMEQNIQNWLVEESLIKEKSNDPNANFHYVINYPDKNNMDIVQPKGKKDLIIIGCGTQVSPEHIQLMNESSNSEKEEFLWELRFRLNNLLLDFQINVDTNKNLNQFIITDNLFEDGLTKNSLIKTINKIFKAKLLCIWLIEKYFGSTTKSNFDIPEINDSMFV